MCGINGIIGKKSIPANIDSMNAVISHRGPDSRGIWNGQNISLGQVRLSIIDPDERANQPMKITYNENNYIITFNGEIYNYLNLKEELKSLGYRFDTKSDTEVLLFSYIQWGEKCLERLNGMWAFALYDESEAKLFCARDRIGKKPFYFYRDKNIFVFSSQPKALLKYGVSSSIDSTGLELYFALGFIPAPHTIYKKIKKLKRANLIIYNYETDVTIEKEYGSQLESTKNLRQTLYESIDSRIISSDFPVGSFLSGGIDSNIISSVYKKLNRSSAKTFSLGFPEGNDESEIVLDTVREKNYDHHQESFLISDIEKYRKVIGEAFDEPFADPGLIPMLKICDVASKKVKVALTGDGGDELFGGYPRHMRYYLKSLMPNFLGKILAIIAPSIRLKDMLSCSFEEFDFIQTVPREVRFESVKNWFNESYDIIKASGLNGVNRVIAHDLFFKTIPDNFMVKADRASMFYGIELRSPFLDWRLVLTSYKPYYYKKKVNLFGMKRVLRSTFKKELPTAVHKSKKKSGFSPPIYNYLNDIGFETAECRDMLRDLNLNESCAENIISSGEKTLRLRLFFLQLWYNRWK